MSLKKPEKPTEPVYPHYSDSNCRYDPTDWDYCDMYAGGYDGLDDYESDTLDAFEGQADLYYGSMY